MKKTILASAIAAATFSGAALAQESNLPTIYGNIQYALSHVDVEDQGSSVDHYDNGSTLGVVHDHEIAPGVTGFFKLELEGIGADDKATSNGIDSLDEAYIGVRGDSFGQVWVGSDDTIYESAVDEITNYFEAFGAGATSGQYDTGEGDLVQYSSPSFGGLQLHGAVQVNGDSKVGGKSYPYQLAATYAVDELELAFAVDSNDGKLDYSKDGLGDDGLVAISELSDNNENTYGVRASFAPGDLRLTAQYQTRKDVGDAWGVFAGYTVGANRFALAYGFAEADNTDDEVSTITLQALHNLSGNMYVYVEGELENEDDGTTDTDTTSVAVGATYYF